MSTSQLEGERTVQFDKHLYNEQVNQLCQPAIQQFDQIIKTTVLFHAVFLGIALAECVLFVLFATFLSGSSILAFSVALLFLTSFSYLTLRLYFQAKQPEQLIVLRDHYIHACKQLLNYQESIPEHHIALANALRKLAAQLHEREYHCYKAPPSLVTLGPSIEKFGCWWHWRDVHKMKEALLLCAIDEHIKLVKCEPTNLEVHAALANAYVMLSSLYIDPRKGDGHEEDKWIPPQRYSQEMLEKFRATAERAIEEFTILNDYAPEDPWVHAQLAYSYHDLQMPQEEIREYETILRLCPEDKESLFKLGMLYFQQGLNAKGLQVYEELKRTHYKKSESLIRFYGEYAPLHPFAD